MSTMTNAKSPNGKNAPDPNEERSNVQFPWRLHELLTEAETNGNDAIISWLPETNAFKVHNKLRFTSEILPSYFNATKYKSFQRNLNLWGFETITEGPNKGGCYHPLFIRGDRDKCHYMTRQKVKGNKPKDSEFTGTLAPKQKMPPCAKVSTKDSLSTLANLASKAPAVSASTNNNAPPPADLKLLSFPKKLHHILAQPDFEDCIRWTADGRCVRVVDPFRFQERVSPNYFLHSSFSSFLVELESYGFKKVSHGGHQECYYHDLMIRGCHHLCKYMDTPNESRRFISDDPNKDLAPDPMFDSYLGPGLSFPPSGLSGGLPPLSSLLPSEAALLQHRQLHGLGGPLSGLLGNGSGGPDLANLQLHGLGPFGRRSSVPGYPLGVTSSESAASRSAITSFLANSQVGNGQPGGGTSSGDNSLRGVRNQTAL